MSQTGQDAPSGSPSNIVHATADSIPVYVVLERWLPKMPDRIARARVLEVFSDEEEANMYAKNRAAAMKRLMKNHEAALGHDIAEFEEGEDGAGKKKVEDEENKGTEGRNEEVEEGEDDGHYEPNFGVR